jgi:hypothetical protein
VHNGRGLGPVVVQQYVDHGAQRQRPAAEGEAQQPGRDQREEQHEQHHERPAATQR